MTKMVDRAYLRENQYRNHSRLDARIALHQRFSAGSHNWHEWLYESFNFQPGMRTLELGCGTGVLWASNRTALPPDVHLILTDLSPGMLAAAQKTLQPDDRFAFLEADAQDLPWKAASFERIIAGHMLFHVPDIPHSLTEIARTLKPGGWLCASCNGNGHFKELYDLLREVLSDMTTQSDQTTERFGLETAPSLLEPFFEDVEVLPFDSNLWVTEVEPLIAYILSMWNTEDRLDSSALHHLRQIISDQIHHHGGFYIRKSTGIVIAKEPRSIPR